MTSPSPLQSVLRLFLSADIVGSTALKQGALSQSSESQASGSSWFPPIATFYRQIDQVFAREWQRYIQDQSARLGWPAGQNPEMWKGLGDEVIYTKILSHHQEAACCIQCWLRAVEEVRDTIQKTSAALDIKASAWVAGFPIMNHEIIFRTGQSFQEDAFAEDGDAALVNFIRLTEYYNDSPKGTYIRDFVGPSMDTGFRLSGLSTPRKMVISVELALILAITIQPNGFGLAPLTLHFDGLLPLKGVLGGKPYPIFWIDALPTADIHQLEDKLRGSEAPNSSVIKEYCETFLADSPSLFVPYISDPSETYFKKVAEGHDEKLKAMASYFELEIERRKIERESERLDEQVTATLKPEPTLETLLRFIDHIRSTSQSRAPSDP